MGLQFRNSNYEDHTANDIGKRNTDDIFLFAKIRLQYFSVKESGDL